MKHFKASDTNFEQEFSDFLALRNQPESDDGLRQTVTEIIQQVRRNGLIAVKEYTQKFDGFAWDGQAFSAEYIAQQAAKCPEEVRTALELAAKRIEKFHAQQTPKGFEQREQGITSGMRWNAIDSVGLYVPGGRASYPSSVLMNAIPATVAGVRRVVMVMPTPEGAVNPAVFAAAQIAGVTEIYPIGGAQAIAYLTHHLKVDKIVGPGNAYVAEAKRQVYGVVGIDSIAGPSEILVVADKTATPNWLAWDLLSQAEHDPNAQSILISDDKKLIQDTAIELENILTDLPKQKISQQAITEYSATILVDDVQKDAPSLINKIAPEHLELCTNNPKQIFDNSKYIGSCFIGHHTPEAIGDYTGGPNHVLPTMGTARFSSGLSVYDFLTRSTYLALDANGFNQLAAATATLADAEGLAAHAGSVRCRMT